MNPTPSEYFTFAGELLPARINYSRDGVRKLEIMQTFVELKDAAENVLAAPPNASARAYCKTCKRAIGQSMPQPKEGRGGRDIVYGCWTSVLTELVVRRTKPDYASLEDAN